jgi:hypothetical protein
VPGGAVVQNVLVRITGGVLAAIVLLCWLYACVAFDYVSWLEYSSPSAPNYASGQIYRESDHDHFYYIAASQVWVHWSGFIAFAAIVVSALCLRAKPFRGSMAALPNFHDASKTQKLAGYFVTLLLLAIFVPLMFFGDHVMQVVLAGSWELPALRR